MLPGEEKRDLPGIFEVFSGKLLTMPGKSAIIPPVGDGVSPSGKATDSDSVIT